MKHCRSHIGKLPQLPVRNGLNPFRPVNDPGIRHQETGDIRPVLIYICVHCPGYDRAGNIGPAPGKCPDTSVRPGAIKAGNDSSLCLCQTFFQQFIRLLRQKGTILIKSDDFRRIDKGIVQIPGHNNTVQILSPGSCIFLPGLPFKLLCNFMKFFFQRQIYFQTGNDLFIPQFNLFELRTETFILLSQFIAFIQHIRHFRIVHMPLTRCRRHYISSLFICMDDFSYLLELPCTGKRTSTKLHYFYHFTLVSLELFIRGLRRAPRFRFASSRSRASPQAIFRSFLAPSASPCPSIPLRFISLAGFALSKSSQAPASASSRNA